MRSPWLLNRTLFLVDLTCQNIDKNKILRPFLQNCLGISSLRKLFAEIEKKHSFTRKKKCGIWNIFKFIIIYFDKLVIIWLSYECAVHNRNRYNISTSLSYYFYLWFTVPSFLWFWNWRIILGKRKTARQLVPMSGLLKLQYQMMWFSDKYCSAKMIFDLKLSNDKNCNTKMMSDLMSKTAIPKWF